MADTTKEIELKEETNKANPLSLKDMPTAYQTDATISIQLPDAPSYVTVSITHAQTGMQVHSMIYTGTDKIQINLANEQKGIYTLLLNIEGTEYIGDFTL